VQGAVDTEHHLIVTHEMTNSGSDRHNWPIWPSRRRLQSEMLEAVADRSYFSSPKVLACHKDGITATCPSR
jgi:hypothetical protein